MSADRETEFTMDNVDYVAVDTDEYGNCTGCAFIEVQCSILQRPSCWAQTREDGKYKIFVKK